mmetsp:Transcript_9692/g.20277  ORF Transcript_9692/g.20277 Transcript_9692/m.20277 type:complete len:93 (-) Transcript_9692:53-331(-)
MHATTTTQQRPLQRRTSRTTNTIHTNTNNTPILDFFITHLIRTWRRGSTASAISAAVQRTKTTLVAASFVEGTGLVRWCGLFRCRSKGNEYT